MLGVRNLAARVTRGGRSLVRHWLPNEPFENEYINRQRLANFLGCMLDHSVFHRLCLRDPKRHIVLGISTNCHWRNWPLSRFTELVHQFTDQQFLLTGLRCEIKPGWEADLEELKGQPNVIDCMDRLSLIDLIKSVATAAAVVTNDTGTAHIANAWSVPGAGLFGPGISEQWAAPEKLKTFHDRTCPHYPCVAWRCESPQNWCMKKIATLSVAEHLRAVLAVPSHSSKESI